MEARGLSPATVRVLAALALGALAGTTHAQDGWKVTLEPYVWIPALEGDGSAEGSPDVDFEIDYPGELSAAVPLALWVEGPGGGAWKLDLLYARWRDDDGATTSETSVSLLEAGYAWPAGEGWALTAGLRGIELELDVEVVGVESDAREAWVDPWVGASGEMALGAGWGFRAAGDVGGFGVGSDFTWQAAALLGWSSTRWRIEYGYRALAVEFDDEELETNLVAHGPFLGVAFRL